MRVHSRRRLSTFTAAAIACAVVAAFSVSSASGDTSSPSARSAHFTLHFAATDPETSPPGQMMDHFASLILKDSGGKISVVNYFNGVTGPTTSNIPNAGSNVFQMTYVNAALLSSYVPSYSFLQTPLFFTDIKTVYKGLRSSAVAALNQQLVAKANTRVLTWEALGFVDMMNSQHPIRTPADIKGMKCRIIPGSQPLQEAYTLLGAEPVPVDATEFYTALSQGTVNCGQDPATVIYSVKLYEVAKYITVMPFQYNPAAVIINNGVYGLLPVKLRKILAKDIAASAQWEIALQTKQASQDITLMQQAGANVVTLTPAQIKLWVNATAKMRAEAVQKYGKALVSAFGIS